MKIEKSWGIAQLVERCLCKADVSGSSPLTSTRSASAESRHERGTKAKNSAPRLTEIVRMLEQASQNLENCIATRESRQNVSVGKTTAEIAVKN